MSKPRGMRVVPLILVVLLGGIVIGLVGGVMAVRLTLQPNWYTVAQDFQGLIAAAILFLGLTFAATVRFQGLRAKEIEVDAHLALKRQSRERSEKAEAAAILARLTLIASDLVIPARLVLKTESNGGALLHQWRHGWSRRCSNALRRAEQAIPEMWAEMSRAQLGEIEQITLKLNQLERIVVEAQDLHELMLQAEPDYFRTSDLYGLDAICLRILQLMQRIDGAILGEDIPTARPHNLERFQETFR
ncbi:MAG TPA: hypothetical protein VF920_14380 [Dongiaceae bacterium]